MADSRNSKLIKYLNLGFEDFQKDLIDFSKIYYPKNSKDLSEASSGKMMIDQAAFIGDVLAHYIEDRFKNSNIKTATDPKQIVNLAESLGYKFQGPRPAGGIQSFYLEVPATAGSFGGYIPDMSYAFNFKNVQLQNTNGIVFECLSDVNFSEVNISSSLECKVSRRDSSGIPTHYVLKKQCEVTAGKTITQTVAVSDYKMFRKVQISEQNVIDIVSVKDSDGDEWFEVPYLAVSTIFQGVKNLDSDYLSVPYSLKLRSVPKRFVKEVDPDTGKTSLLFGTGKAVDVGENFIPDPADVSIDLRGKLQFSPGFIDPQNFLKTKTLGLAPYNTTLTIKARVGGGKVSNTSVGSLNSVISKEFDSPPATLDQSKVNAVISSFSSENEDVLIGGDEAETKEDIKQYSSAFFAAQGRVTTREDYVARFLSLPSQFGRVFRVYASYNPKSNGGVQVYVLAKNHLGQVVVPSVTLSKNLKTYISKYTRLNQSVDILPGRIINLGIEYVVVVEPGYNKTKVKLETLKKIKDYFNINNWQLSQPIVLDDVRCLIKETEGVLAISELKIVNKNNTMEGNSYSSEVFNVNQATKNSIIFCPFNAIFEVKYPNGSDIKVGAI